MGRLILLARSSVVSCFQGYPCRDRPIWALGQAYRRALTTACATTSLDTAAPDRSALWQCVTRVCHRGSKPALRVLAWRWLRRPSFSLLILAAATGHGHPAAAARPLPLPRAEEAGGEEALFHTMIARDGVSASHVVDGSAYAAVSKHDCCSRIFLVAAPRL
jgi:hypothetical protein